MTTRSLPFSLARPDFCFISTWLIVVFLYLIAETPLTPPFPSSVCWMLGINAFTGVLTVYVTWWILRKRRGQLTVAEFRSVDSVDVALIHDFSIKLFAIWAMIYIVQVIYSGGFPLIWAFLKTGKTYADFGISSVTGLAIMVRSFLGVIWIYLFNITRQKKYLLYVLGFAALCALELSRGLLFQYILHIFCAFVLVNRITFRTALLVGTTALVLGGMFMWLGSMRGAIIKPSDYGLQGSVFNLIPADFFFLWTYIVSPLGNVNHAVQLGITPTYLPINTGTLLLPTVLRSIFGVSQYPIALIVPELNACSAYAPLIADFGIIGASLFFAAFQLICAYVYLRAKQGSMMHLAMYPPLFISIVLSIFYLYAVSMSVVLYPILCLMLSRYAARHRSRMKSLYGTPASVEEG